MFTARFATLRLRAGPVLASNRRRVRRSFAHLWQQRCEGFVQLFRCGASRLRHIWSSSPATVDDGSDGTDQLSRIELSANVFAHGQYELGLALDHAADEYDGASELIAQLLGQLPQGCAFGSICPHREHRHT